MFLSRCAIGGLFALTAAALSGCGGSKGDSMLMRESFNSEDTYSRSFDVAPAQACEAARRALLSQGYVVAKADADSVEGSKNFQPKDDEHEQLDLKISCAAQGAGKSLVFVSALQDRYALKKSASSASVGVGVLGSVSLPFGSSDDSLVRVASSTVQDAHFYDRFFERLSAYLPAKAPAAPPATAAPAPAPSVAPPPTPATPTSDDVPASTNAAPVSTPANAAPATTAATAGDDPGT